MCSCLAGLCCCFVFLSSNSFRLSLLRSFVNKNFELFFRFLFELRPAGFLPALLHSYASSESPLSEFLISDESYSIIGVFELQAEFSFLYKKISHLYPWYISTISHTRILDILSNSAQQIHSKKIFPDIQNCKAFQKSQCRSENLVYPRKNRKPRKEADRRKLA